MGDAKRGKKKLRYRPTLTTTKYFWDITRERDNANNRRSACTKKSGRERGGA